MKRIYYGSYIRFSLLFLFAFISCSEEGSFDYPVTDSSTSPKNKGGKDHHTCTTYKFRYYLTSSLANSIFTSDPTILENCVDEFRGVERITNIKLGSTWTCIIENDHDMNVSGVVNCGAFLVLYYHYNGRKYQVVLEGGGWTNGCPPQENSGPSFFTFDKMYIHPDGRHEKSCLAREIPIDIGEHTFYIENLGPV